MTRQALAALEAGTREQEIRVAEATAARAGSELRFARAEEARIAQLMPNHLASQQQLDQARLQVQVAQSALQQATETLQLLREGPRAEDIARARAELAARQAVAENAGQQLRYVQLQSPASGVLSVGWPRRARPVAAGQPVLRLAELDRPWVRAWLNATDLARVRHGQAAEVRVDAYPDTVFHGRLSFVSPQAEFTPKTVETRELRVDLVYRIKVDVDDAAGRSGRHAGRRAAAAGTRAVNGVVIEARGLCFARAGHAVLRGVDVQVHAGEIFGLVGADGAGKSTLMRILLGQLRPQQGELRVLGQPADSPALRAQTAYMPQGFGLYSDLSVRENLRFFAELHGLEAPSAARRSARPVAPHRAGGFRGASGRRALGRHDAEARPGLRPAERAAADVSRRADHRGRSAGAGAPSGTCSRGRARRGRRHRVRDGQSSRRQSAAIASACSRTAVCSAKARRSSWPRSRAMRCSSGSRAARRARSAPRSPPCRAWSACSRWASACTCGCTATPGSRRSAARWPPRCRARARSPPPPRCTT